MADWKTGSERVLARSEAVLHALGQLGGPWRALARVGGRRAAASGRSRLPRRRSQSIPHLRPVRSLSRSRRRNGESASSISSTLARDERDSPSGRTSGASGYVANRAEPALQPRPRAGPARPTHLVHLQLRGALGQHGPLHPHLHARLRVDGERHELVAGPRHDPPRQHDRPRPDPAELASRHEVRHSLSCLRARRLRHDRLEPSRADACARRLRLVRHPGLDWRRGAADVLRRADARLAATARQRLRRSHDDRVAVVSALLGPQRLHHLSRDGSAALGRELGGAIRARHDRGPARVGGPAQPTDWGRCSRSQES